MAQRISLSGQAEMWPLSGNPETCFVNFVLFCGYSFSVRILATKEHKDHKEPSDLE